MHRATHKNQAVPPVSGTLKLQPIKGNAFAANAAEDSTAKVIWWLYCKEVQAVIARLMVENGVTNTAVLERLSLGRTMRAIV